MLCKVIKKEIYSTFVSGSICLQVNLIHYSRPCYFPQNDEMNDKWSSKFIEHKMLKPTITHMGVTLYKHV